MARSKKSTERSPKNCRDCERWSEIKARVRVSEALERAIKAVETKIRADDFKPTPRGIFEADSDGERIQAGRPEGDQG